MKSIKLELQLKNLHERIIQYEQIKGSLLIRKNGLHLSSKIPIGMDSRRLSANIAHLYNLFRRINKGKEVCINLYDGNGVYIRELKNSKVILTLLINKTGLNEIKELIYGFSEEFNNIL
ncbi:MAG: roadblock/LC7 domain-containing protein [Candidatus Helarchaeota archaeon]